MKMKCLTVLLVSNVCMILVVSYCCFHLLGCWYMLPLSYSLDLTVDGAEGIILAEIFETVPAGISVLEAAVANGKDKTLCLKCTIPESRTASIGTNQNWRVKDKSYASLDKRIKWWPSDTNDIDYVYKGNSSGLYQMLVMKPVNSNRVLYISTFGPQSSAFWEFAKVHSKPVKP